MGKTTAKDEELAESNVIEEEGKKAEIENGSCPLENSQVQKLAEEIESGLKSLNYSQHVPPHYCIFLIPEKLYEEYEAPYRPQYVFTGPLAYQRFLREHDENQKRRYLDSFLNRATHMTLLDFINLINGSLAKIQGCYERTYCRYWDDKNKIFKQDKLHGSVSDSSLLITMILVDAGFILELLLKDYYSKEGRVENDVIFAKMGTIHDIKQDLMLLHNQLPFFLLRDMYQLAISDNYPDFPSFLQLTCHFFSLYYNQNIPIQDVLSKKNPQCAKYISKLEEAKHFTDMIRTFQQPYSFKKPSDNEESQCWKWILGGKKYFMNLISQKPKENEHGKILEEGKMQGEYLYSAFLLLEVGIKFKVSLGRCLFDIEFDESKGDLKIPPLRVDKSTESFYGNLMVWEQYCYPSNDTFICDYIFLMAYLIKSVKDVDLLVRKRIIVNQLGSPDAIVALFNRLCKHIRVEKNRYSDLFMKLNEYNAVRHHGWIAILKLQYFSTPWKGVATIAATILLVLTLIQTICAVISL